MTLLLVVNGPDGQSVECNLATAEFPVLIGRKGGGAHLQVDDTQMSRKHCEITFEDDEYIIKDLKSSNGTWINGADREQAILTDGDIISVGGSTMTVKRLLDKQDDPLIGKQLNGFMVQAMIGQGSQATVFRGTQVNLDRAVAMKIMRSEGQTKSQVDAFLKEAREAGRLNHPHVVQAHDVFQVDGLYVLIMELMEGGSALHALQQDGPIDYEEAVVILQQMGEAINYAQTSKLVHRDVKPANILSTQNGIYKLADLGIATRLRDGSSHDSRMHGTPLYMSPEQARGDKVDSRSDIYGLGASIWHLITGAPVFTGPPREVIAAHMHREVPNLAEAAPGINPGLQELIVAMLAKNPNDRPLNGLEVTSRAGAFAGSAEMVVTGSASNASGRKRTLRGRGAGRRSTARGSTRTGVRRRSRRRR